MIKQHYTDTRAQDGFGESQFLKEADFEIKKHIDLSSKKLQSILKRYDLSYIKLSEIVVCSNLDRHRYELSEIKKLKKESEGLHSRLRVLRAECDSLQKECEKLPHETTQKNDEMSDLSLQLKQLKTEKANIDLDSKRQKKKFREDFEAMKVIKRLYKDHLDFYVTLICAKDDTSEFLVCFKNCKPTSIGSMPSDALKIQHNSKTGIWKLIDTNPSLSNFEIVSKKLEESQDVLGLLGFLRPCIRSKSNDFKNVNKIDHESILIA